MTYDEFAQIDLHQHSASGMEHYTTYKVHVLLQTYIPPALLILGVIGNVLSFTVFRKYFSQTPIYSYLAVLAVLDTVVIFVGLLRLWIMRIASTDIQSVTGFVCKFMTFLCYASSDSSAWVVVVLTVNRYTAVCHPFKANDSSLKKSRWVILGIIIILCVFNAHIFWTVDLKVSANNTEGLVYQCQVSHDHEIANVILQWIHSAIYSFFPGVLIFVFNARIIKEMCINNNKLRLMRKRKEMSFSKKMPKNRGLTFLLLAVSFTFFLTTMPFSIILIITDSFNKEQQRNSTSADFILIRTVAELLMYMNHSANFLLYCTAGSKFRTQLRSLLCKKRT